MLDRLAHSNDEVVTKEIEITPEMIEAGMIEYNRRWCWLADADDDVAREMLRAAYLAMRRLLPSPGYQWL
jgi:hypothetical protein